MTPIKNRSDSQQDCRH